MKQNKIRILVLAFGMLTQYAAFAQAPGGRHSGGRRGPSPEALDACKGKEAGAVCSFQGPEDKSVTGSCFAPDASKPLACRPSRS